MSFCRGSIAALGYSSQTKHFQFQRQRQQIFLALYLQSLARVIDTLAQVALAQPEIDRIENLRRQILHYCVEHPEAKDTVEGILTWWFPGGGSQWSTEEVKKALDGLIDAGWFTRRRIRQAEEIYGVSKDKLPEIREFLRGFGSVMK